MKKKHYHHLSIRELTSRITKAKSLIQKKRILLQRYEAALKFKTYVLKLRAWRKSQNQNVG